MLGVDRHDLTAAGPPHGVHHRPAGDEALLVREGEPLALHQRGERRRQPGEPDHRVEHDVDLGERRELAEHLGLSAGRPGAVGGDAELGGLGREQLGVAAAGERRDLVLVAVVPHDVERLRPDGARRPEQGDAPAGAQPIVSARPR